MAFSALTLVVVSACTDKLLQPLTTTSETPSIERKALTSAAVTMEMEKITLRENVDKAALHEFLEQFSPKSRAILLSAISKGEFRNFKGNKDLEALAHKIYLPTPQADRDLVARAVAVWTKPVVLVKSTIAGKSTVRIHVGDAITPDTVSMASQQLTVEYLASAMKAVATLRNRTSTLSGQSITATVENAEKDVLPQQWKQYLDSQLMTLNQSREGVLMKPLSAR